jgi:hypothetical protein
LGSHPSPKASNTQTKSTRSAPTDATSPKASTWHDPSTAAQRSNSSTPTPQHPRRFPPTSPRHQTKPVER